MNTYASTVPMRGWRGWANITLCVLVFAVGAAVYLLGGPDRNWILYLFSVWMCGLPVFGIFHFVRAMRRKQVWVLKADPQRIEWYESDRTGTVHERQDVAVGDLVAIEHIRSGEDGGIYLKTRAGRQLLVSNHLGSKQDFLAWVRAHCPNVSVVVK